MTTHSIPFRQIRAIYNSKTIRVYQAYNDAIADSALKKGTFVSPPFSMTRMTWIKPSFLWMMYRSGWGQKDANQNRVLAIDISREGFEWALEHSMLSHKPNDIDPVVWQTRKDNTPVRLQWDPERDVHFTPLEHRSIQIGLTQEAVELYVNDWIQDITDVTTTAIEVHQYAEQGLLDQAHCLLPKEEPYPLKVTLAQTIGATL